MIHAYLIMSWPYLSPYNKQRIIPYCLHWKSFQQLYDGILICLRYIQFVYLCKHCLSPNSTSFASLFNFIELTLHKEQHIHKDTEKSKYYSVKHINLKHFNESSHWNNFPFNEWVYCKRTIFSVFDTCIWRKIFCSRLAWI